MGTPAVSIELRCPNGPRRLFAKMLSDGERPRYVPGNLVEFSCQDCKKLLRTQGRTVRRVLHRFDIAGTLVETAVVEDETG